MDTDGFIFPSEIDNDDSASNASMEGDEVSDLLDAEPDNCSAVGSNLALESCSEVLQEVLNEYKAVKKKLKDRDILAGQLAFGIYLQSEMEKCKSSRCDFPIHLKFEARELSSGSSLFLVSLRNTAEYPLLNWNISFTISLFSSEKISDADLLKTFTKTVSVECLSREQDFSTEIFFTGTRFSSWLVRPQLVKVLPLANEAKVFCLELDPYYYCLWNKMKVIASIGGEDRIANEKLNERAVSYTFDAEEQKLNLPEALIFLLCNGTTSPVSLLRWILMSDSISAPEAKCTYNYGKRTHSVNVIVRKGPKKYIVGIRTVDRNLKRELLLHLQTRVLVRFLYHGLASQLKHIFNKSGFTHVRIQYLDQSASGAKTAKKASRL